MSNNDKTTSYNKLQRHFLFPFNDLSVHIRSYSVPYFRIWTEYGEIRRISAYSVSMRENVDQNHSEYGHLLRSKTSRQLHSTLVNSYAENKSMSLLT